MNTGSLQETITSLYTEADAIDKSQISIGLPKMYEGIIRNLQDAYIEAQETLPQDLSSDSSALVKAVLSFDKTRQTIRAQLERGGQPNPSHHANYIRKELDKIVKELNTYET